LTDIEAILDRQVSDPTLQARRDEWIEAGVVRRAQRAKLSLRSTGLPDSTSRSRGLPVADLPQECSALTIARSERRDRAGA